MFLKGVWFIIAVLLLGHNPAVAESCLRVCKNGVVYYYFASRETTQPRQAGVNAPKLRGEAWVQVSSPGKMLLASVKGRSQVKTAAVARLGAPAPKPFGPGTAENLQDANPADAKSMILPGADYLIRLLTKLGYRSPLAWPAYAGFQRVDQPQDVPAVQAPQLAVPEGRKNLGRYVQEQLAELGRGQQGSPYFMASGFRGYRFPVGGPFSFRDTWGESRSGGRVHRAVDIFAPEGSEVYAITAGVVATLATLPEAGITLFLQGQDGKGYGYMHLQGYTAGLVEGKTVRTGELIGYVGRTGMQTSAAHLHLQVYADKRLCKDDLVNPYGFLVQLCHGIGVTDLDQHKLAQLTEPEIRINRIQVYGRSHSTALRGGVRQVNVKGSPVMVIRNF